MEACGKKLNLGSYFWKPLDEDRFDATAAELNAAIKSNGITAAPLLGRLISGWY